MNEQIMYRCLSPSELMVSYQLVDRICRVTDGPVTGGLDRGTILKSSSADTG